MKSKVLSNRAAWVAGLVLMGLAFASFNTLAKKPAPPPPPPPPPSPVTIAYEQHYGQEGIYTMAADGSSKTLVLKTTGNASYIHPSISPDGTKMAFSRTSGAGVDLCVANLNGTGLTVVHTFVSDQDRPTWFVVVWSPDGTKLLFNSLSRDEDLLYVDLANPGVVQAVPVNLVPMAGPISISGDIDPVTSGYQGKLALGGVTFSGGPEPLANSIRILDLTFDESGAPQIGPTILPIETADTIYQLSWSPTGDYLAYNGIGLGTGTRLHLIGMVRDGAEIVPVGDWVVEDGVYNNSRIAWSPDSQFVAYAKSAGGMPDILRSTLKVDGEGNPYFANPVNLTSSPKSYELNPDWSPTCVAGQ